MNLSTSAPLAILVGLCIITAPAPFAIAQQHTRSLAPAADGGAGPAMFSAEQSQLTIIQEARLRNHFSFWAGAGFPMGAFGSTTNEKAGYAKPGFTMGLGYLVGITHEFGWASQIDFIANSMDGFRMTFYGNQGPTPLKPSTGTWLTFWPMTGLEIAGDIAPTVRLYGDVMFGMLIGAMPQVKFSYPPDRTTLGSSTATAFAYGFAGGVTIENKFLLRLCYAMATPEYEVDITGTGFPRETIRFEQPTSVLRIVVGIEI